MLIKYYLLASERKNMKHILRLVNYCKANIYYYFSTINIFILTFRSKRPSSEEACSIPLPVLATIVTRLGKKLVDVWSLVGLHYFGQRIGQKYYTVDGSKRQYIFGKKDGNP